MNFSPQTACQRGRRASLGKRSSRSRTVSAERSLSSRSPSRCSRSAAGAKALSAALSVRPVRGSRAKAFSAALS
eukprot:5195329-Karenia_brevis.AAC.1